MIPRRIVSIDVESDDSVVVHLDCRHRRHVRDRPPLERHPWVRDPAAHAERVGTSIECGWCETLRRPDDVARYREGPVWDAATIPAGLRARHTLKAGVWGELVVLAGRVRLRWLAPLDRTVELGAGDTVSIPPELPHELEIVGDVQLRVDFYR